MCEGVDCPRTETKRRSGGRDVRALGEKIKRHRPVKRLLDRWRRIGEEKESRAPPTALSPVFPDVPTVRTDCSDRHGTFVTRSGRWLDSHDSARTSSPPNPFFDCSCRAPGSVGSKGSGVEDRRGEGNAFNDHQTPIVRNVVLSVFFLICPALRVGLLLSIGSLSFPPRIDRAAIPLRNAIKSYLIKFVILLTFQWWRQTFFARRGESIIFIQWII